jgi:hypothetical protein
VQEKRRHEGVTIDLPILCESQTLAPFAAIAADVSIGGLFIRAEKAPPFGTELVIVGDFPGIPGARLPAVVRWASPGGFGVQFLLLGARETHMLTSLVQRSRA